MIVLLALLACREPPPPDTGTPADTDTGAPDTSGETGDDTDTADTDTADTDTADTAEPPFEPYALLVLGQFAWFDDGTVGTATSGTSSFPPTVYVRVVGAAWFEGESSASCLVKLRVDAQTRLEGVAWTFTDAWSADLDGDGVSESGTVDLVHHGFLLPEARDVGHDCPFDITGVAEADWGVGVGRMRPDVEDALRDAEIEAEDYYGGSVWHPDLGITAVDYGFGFTIDEEGAIVRDETGTGIRLDARTVGDDPLGRGFYQTVQAFALPAELAFGE